MKRLVNVEGGEFFAIPLFLSNRSDLERFKKSEFLGEDKKFVYCRIIKDQQGGGIFIEVFNLVARLISDLDKIIQSGRLFRPVVISGLEIYKKRWQKIGKQKHYDKEIDSNYSQIQLVLEPAKPRLWQNGIETPISIQESESYEHWQIWTASRL